MTLTNLLKQMNMTKYRLALLSGVPHTTVIDICSGKTRIEKCSADTIYKLAKALDVPMEALIEDALLPRSSFETYKSNVCHMVHDMGDMAFIIKMLELDEVRRLYDRAWYPECLYLLAMIDYLCRLNKLPICKEYADIRKMRLETTVYPSSVIAASLVTKNDNLKQHAYNQAIPEFKRFNIVENEVRNVN